MLDLTRLVLLDVQPPTANLSLRGMCKVTMKTYPPQQNAASFSYHLAK